MQVYIWSKDFPKYDVRMLAMDLQVVWAKAAANKLSLIPKDLEDDQEIPDKCFVMNASEGLIETYGIKVTPRVAEILF